MGQAVGDQDGAIQNPSTKGYYIENPETVFQQGGQSVQKHWAYDRDLTQDNWNKTKKTHCADGYRVGNHVGGDCKGVLQDRTEGFSGGSWLNVGLATIAILGAAVMFTRMRR